MRVLLPAQIVAGRIIAVVRGHGPDAVVGVADALVAGGIDVIEITLDSPDALESIAALADRPIAVGAGTVMTASAADAAIAAGAGFVVSPHFDASIVAATVARNVAAVPGAATPTEIVAAWEAGASAVKVFPAMPAGPGYLRTVRGPLASIPLIPTGGVTADNAADFLAAGAAAVGLGGWLTGSGDPATIAERARRLVAACG